MAHSPLGRKPGPDDPSNYWQMQGSPNSVPYLQSQYMAAPHSGSTGPYSSPSLSMYGLPSSQEGNVWGSAPSNSAMRSASMISQEEIPSQFENYHYASFPDSEPKRRGTNASEIHSVHSLQNVGPSSSAPLVDSHGAHTLGSFHGQQLVAPPYTTYGSWSTYPEPQPMLSAGQQMYGSWYGPTPSQPGLASKGKEGGSPKYLRNQGDYLGPS